MTLFNKCSSKGRGAGRKRREGNFRPLPRPMDGSNTAIGNYFSQALALSASSSKVCSQKNPWRVRLRQGHASRRSSRPTNAIRYLHSRHGVIAEGVRKDTLKAPHPPSGHHPCRASCRATHREHRLHWSRFAASLCTGNHDREQCANDQDRTVLPSTNCWCRSSSSQSLVPRGAPTTSTNRQSSSSHSLRKR